MAGACPMTSIGSGYVGRGRKRIIVVRMLNVWQVCKKTKGDPRHVIVAECDNEEIANWLAKKLKKKRWAS